MIRRTALGVALGGIAALAWAALDPSYRNFYAMPFHPSFWEVLPTTIIGAVRVWFFWGVAAAVSAGLLLRHTTIGRFDSVLLGALTPWVFSFLVGTLVGPFGLLSGWLLWATIAIGGVVLLQRPPARDGGERTPGLRLVGIAALLVLPFVLLEQLGSPVPPHFDVFAPLAAAQRIVTFGYLPFDSDAYGYYGRAAGMPALELFYAVLTLGSGVPHSSLAASATIAPMAALFLLATYRLGCTMAGDRFGGFAALLLLDTMLFHVLPYGHGRYTSFVPAIAGLAYVADPHPVRRVAGGLLLGTALACHAIIGSFAMATALVGGLPWVVGASVLSLATVLAAVAPPVSSLVLTAFHALGVGLLVVAARWWKQPSSPTLSRLGSLVGRIALLGLAALIVRSPPITLFAGFAQCWKFPLVFPLAAFGATVLACTRAPARRALVAAPCLVGLAAAIAGSQTTIPGLPWAAHDFTSKAEFWVPMSLCFPAAAGLAWLSRWSMSAVTIALVGMLVVPWAPHAAAALGRDPCAQAPLHDPNYNAIPWAEAVGQYLAFAKNGYWNPRWAHTPAEEQLYDLLREEVAAGRITAEMHIPHVAPIVYLFQDTILFSVFVGINGDLYMADYLPNDSISGGRVRPVEAAVDVIAQRPPYVVIHERTHSGQALKPAFLETLPIAGYEVMMDVDGVKLLRWPNA